MLSERRLCVPFPSLGPTRVQVRQPLAPDMCLLLPVIIDADVLSRNSAFTASTRHIDVEIAVSVAVQAAGDGPAVAGRCMRRKLSP